MTRRELIKLLSSGAAAAGAGPTSLIGKAIAGPAAADPADAQSSMHPAATPKVKATSSARAVLSRLLGPRAEAFSVGWIPPENGHEVFEVSASGGKVSVKGSSGLAICRGAYTYLRKECHSMVTWSGQHLEIPSRFPDWNGRAVSPYQFVLYYNVCTFGYTTAFWNWERWQRELDWMALHGVNLPLAMDGQEIIWDRVWKSLGLTQAEVDRFSVGPGQLPWHRMGNLNYFDGPLPRGWMEQKRVLQKKIASSMTELGMSPVVPAFAGHVPEAFMRVFPKATVHTQIWAGTSMPSLSKTFLLDPKEVDLYKEIGGRFIREYKKEYGLGEYYLADPVNEMRVPVSKEHRYEDLANFGRTIYEGILAGDPNGKWMKQSWLFYSDWKFWDEKSIEAFLSKVPDDRMIIIDYTGDAPPSETPSGRPTQPVWERTNGFFGKHWINGMLHTLGGNNNIKGNLELIDSQPAEVLASSHKGNLVGWCMCPEGTQTNEVAYELMTDIGWEANKINLDDWITSYCQSRYGGCPPAMTQAWKHLMQSAYGEEAWVSKHSWQRTPSLNPTPIAIKAGPVFQQAVREFLSCADLLKSSQLYRNDLIEFVAQAVGGSVDFNLAAACQAHRNGEPDVRDRKARESLDMLRRIDGIMNLREDRRLETWCNDAQGWGHSPAEAVYYQSNARLLITYWGWPPLSDYATRVWSGLIRDYFIGRWRTFFHGLAGKAPESLEVWQQTWLSTPYKASQPLPVPDLESEAKQMLADCEAWKTPV
jgi:alpha-N-acetylglucosaminidase